MGRFSVRGKSRAGASVTSWWRLTPLRAADEAPRGTTALQSSDGQPYLSVAPAPGGRLANGLVVDASVQARLLGLRLLTVDAQIRLVPADFGVCTAAESSSGAPTAELDNPRDPLARASQTLDEVGRQLSG